MPAENLEKMAMSLGLVAFLMLAPIMPGISIAPVIQIAPGFSIAPVIPIAPGFSIAPGIPIASHIALIPGTPCAATPCGAALAKVSTSPATNLSADQKKQLSVLEDQALKYFLDNQIESGLVLDRQTNFAKPINTSWCSLSATGMGLIAIALASGPDHHLITREDAIARVRKALLTAKTLPAIHGMMPHFFDPITIKWQSSDQVSTIDSSWFIAGGLWAAHYLKDEGLKKLADGLYDRVDWDYWANKDTAGGAPVLCMGMDDKGQRWKGLWDRINGEAAFMYVLAIGAREHALPPSAWTALKPYNKTVAGEELASGDLGLFVFQYSNELTDLKSYKGNKIDLYAQAVKGAKANYDACKEMSAKYKTFQHFWGLSAGDGPPNKGQGGDAYRAYAPANDVDGTAHIMATLASIDVAPDMVLANVQAAEEQKDPPIHGRYGFSNINLDKNWASRDVVGIDVGVAAMALENMLDNDEVRRVWEQLPSSKRAAERLAEAATTANTSR